MNKTFLKQITLGDAIQIFVGIAAIAVLFHRVSMLEDQQRATSLAVQELQKNSVRLTTIIEENRDARRRNL